MKTLKELLDNGAVLLDKESNIYESGNDKYMIKDGKVINHYYLNDEGLRRYEDRLRMEEDKWKVVKLIP